MKAPSRRVLAGSAAALLFFPILIDLCIHDRRRVFAYLASDAYYYLTVAWNFAHVGKLSYDQVRASNGFHPLWQILEALLFTVGRALPEMWLLWLVVLGSAALLAAALWLFSRHFSSPLVALLPVGFFGLIVMPEYIRLADRDNLPFFGTTWALVDGMESAVAVFCFALALRLYVDGKRHVLFGFSLAALTLARLDHGFFSGMLLVGYVAHLRRDLRAAAFAVIAFVAPLVVYLGANKLFVGAALPVSGMIKSTFPDVFKPNLDKLWGIFKDVGNTTPWRFYRLVQIILPVLATLGADGLLLRRRRERIDEALLLCVPAIWILAAYDILFVELSLHGHWYFPVSTIWVSLLVLRLLDGWPQRPIAGWIVIALACGLSYYSFFTLNARRNYQSGYAGFYLDYAPRIREYYDSRGIQPRFLEIDDGIFAFSTHYPCISGMGLGLDPAAVRSFQKHQLFPLSYVRGYDRLASVMYVIARGIDERTPSDELWPWFRGVLSPLDGKRFEYQIEYRMGAFVIAKASQKN